MNPSYGIFEIDSSQNFSISKHRRVIGTEPKIMKNADRKFTAFRETNKIPEYRNNQSFGLDNCRDIFMEINCLKKEVEKYRSIGIEKNPNHSTHEINWNKIALNTEREIQKLYERL